MMALFDYGPRGRPPFGYHQMIVAQMQLLLLLRDTHTRYINYHNILEYTCSCTLDRVTISFNLRLSQSEN